MFYLVGMGLFDFFTFYILRYCFAYNISSTYFFFTASVLAMSSN